ncbi:MAG: hypothetical protein RUDDFDWM_000546 [Candidatus Fervidibacterota bacterium]
MEVTIRHALPKDIAAIVRVANCAFLEEARLPWLFGVGLVEHLRNFPDWQFVAEVDGRIVGFLVGKPGEDRAFISWIAVHPAHWRKGIGGKLLKAIEEKANKAGLRIVELGTPFARKFYEKYGYKCVNIQKKLVLNLSQRNVDKPQKISLKNLSLDDLPRLLKFFGEEKEYLDTASKFFSSLADDPHLSLLGERRNEIVGVAIATTARLTPELVVISKIFAKDFDYMLSMLNGLEYVCSCYGKRWLGVSLPIPHVDEEKLLSLGWEDAKMPNFWTLYWMRKEW